MDRKSFLELWNTSWNGEGWFTPWTKALEGLSPEQALWTPAPGRHSIWQNVSHVCFWREYNLILLAGSPKPGADAVEKGNFEAPAKASPAAWAAALNRLEASHRRIGEIIADASKPLDRVRHHLAHDAYHLGQIMQIRALLGMDPII